MGYLVGGLVSPFKVGDEVIGCFDGDEVGFELGRLVLGFDVG